MYSQKHYARRRTFSNIGNKIWSVIMVIFVLCLVAACVYGCMRYLNVAKTVPL